MSFSPLVRFRLSRKLCLAFRLLSPDWHCFETRMGEYDEKRTIILARGADQQKIAVALCPLHGMDDLLSLLY